MANFGLSSPFMAKLNVSTGAYSGGFRCGKAINTDVTPNYQSASLYADNSLGEYVEEFVDADVNVGTDRLPAGAAEVLFGHTTDAESGEETSSANDSGNYVGYGFWVASMEDGVKSYIGIVIHKVKFSEGEEGFETKGDNITFQTPSLSGKATALDDGTWRTKSKKFASIAEAESWVKEKLNITDTSSQSSGD